MSYLWKKTEKWNQWCESKNCPVCKNLSQPGDYVTIAETESSWIEAHPNVPLKGTCYVMSKKHAVELYDLSEEDAFAFLKDVMITAQALKEVTGATKINYEIHGNTVPHLHLHLFPRYLVGDRFSDSVIDPRQIDPPVYSGNDFHEFTEMMRKKISGALK